MLRTLSQEEASPGLPLPQQEGRERGSGAGGWRPGQPRGRQETPGALWRVCSAPGRLAREVAPVSLLPPGSQKLKGGGLHSWSSFPTWKCEISLPGKQTPRRLLCNELPLGTCRGAFMLF